MESLLMHIFSNAESYAVLLAWIVMPLGIYVIYRVFISSEFVVESAEITNADLKPAPATQTPTVELKVISEPVPESLATDETEMDSPAEEGESDENSTDKALREMIAEDRVNDIEKNDPSQLPTENFVEEEPSGEVDFTFSHETDDESENSDDSLMTTESRGPDSGPLEPGNTPLEDEEFSLSASSHGSVEPPSYADESPVEMTMEEEPKEDSKEDLKEEIDDSLSQNDIDTLLRKQG